MNHTIALYCIPQIVLELILFSKTVTSIGPSRRHFSQPRVQIHCSVKVKAISVQVWTGPEGSRRLRLPEFKTVST
jgi:hypothetical protein